MELSVIVSLHSFPYEFGATQKIQNLGHSIKVGEVSSSLDPKTVRNVGKKY